MPSKFMKFFWDKADVQYYMLQVYNIVIHNFYRLYSIYSYYKVLVKIPYVVQNIFVAYLFKVHENFEVWQYHVLMRMQNSW